MAGARNTAATSRTRPRSGPGRRTSAPDVPPGPRCRASTTPTARSSAAASISSGRGTTSSSASLAATESPRSTVSRAAAARPGRSGRAGRPTDRAGVEQRPPPVGQQQQHIARVRVRVEHSVQNDLAQRCVQQGCGRGPVLEPAQLGQQQVAPGGQDLVESRPRPGLRSSSGPAAAFGPGLRSAPAEPVPGGDPDDLAGSSGCGWRGPGPAATTRTAVAPSRSGPAPRRAPGRPSTSSARASPSRRKQNGLSPPDYRTSRSGPRRGPEAANATTSASSVRTRTSTARRRERPRLRQLSTPAGPLGPGLLLVPLRKSGSLQVCPARAPQARA